MMALGLNPSMRPTDYSLDYDYCFETCKDLPKLICKCLDYLFDMVTAKPSTHWFALQLAAFPFRGQTYAAYDVNTE